MRLHLSRDVLSPTWTLGVLTVDHEDGRGPLSFGFTVEDTDRGLTSADPLDRIRAVKVRDRTAIPTGTYRVRTTWSPKYRRQMPLVCDVPGWAGVRLHSGNDAGDSSGCILPGLARDVVAGTVSRSRAACAWLYARIAEVEAAGGEVWIEVARASDPAR